MKPDEQALLLALAEASDPEELPGDVAARLHIHPNRAAYIFAKWTRKGWYDYGVNVLLGWLEPAGFKAAESLKAESKV